MHTKFYIYLGIFIGSTAGSWLGSLIDHGSYFGPSSIVLGLLGSFIGIWIGYKLSQQ